MPILGRGIGSASGCALLEGATAYVGFDSCKEPYTNYWLCDGTADDVEIQAACTYVSGLGGGTVRVGRGTYQITAQVDPGDNVSVIGSGYGTLLQATAQTFDIFHLVGTVGDNRENVVISDMRLVSGDCAIRTDYSNECLFKNLWISGSHYGVLLISLSWRNTVENVKITETDTYGIEFYNVDDNVAVNCICKDLTGTTADFLARQGSGNSFVDCRSINSAGHGFLLQDGEQYSEVVGGYVYSGAKTGVKFQSSAASAVSDLMALGVIVQGCTNEGLSADASLGNTVDDCGFIGCSVDGCSWGVLINANCNRTLIDRSNILENNTNGFISNAGTDTVLPGYAVYLKGLWYESSGEETVATERVYLLPLIIDRITTLDQIVVFFRGTVAGNHIAGIYADAGNTPATGALLVSTGSVAKSGTWRTDEIPITATTLYPGLYWMAYVSSENTTLMFKDHNLLTIDATVASYYYDPGSYTLTDPCPAVTRNDDIPAIWVRVSSMP